MLRILICYFLFTLVSCKPHDYNSNDAIPLLARITWQIDPEDKNPSINPSGARFETFEIEDGVSCELTHEFNFTTNNTLVQRQIAPHCFYATEYLSYSYIYDFSSNTIHIQKYLPNKITGELEDVAYKILLLNKDQLKLSYFDNGVLTMRSFKPL